MGTDSQRDRLRARDSGSNGRPIERQREGLTKLQVERLTNRQTERQKYIRTEWQTDRHRERKKLIDRHQERQTVTEPKADRESSRQTYSLTNKDG